MLRELVLVLAATFCYGQAIEVKDRHGIALVEVNEVKAFRFSSYFGREVAELSFVVRNVAGLRFDDATLLAVIRKKDGKTVELPFALGVFEKGTVLKRERQFWEAPYSVQDFESIGFAFPEWWQSPEDKRLAAEEEAEQAAAEEAKRKKKEASAKAVLAAKLRLLQQACSRTYRETVNKRVSDLTVGETERIGACRSLGFYQR